MKAFLDKLIRKLNPTRERIIALVFSFAFTYLIYLDSNLFDHKILSALWILAGVLFFFIFLGFMTIAGATVLRAFFLLGAEVTLLIFLAQSYCGTRFISRTEEGDNALAVLIIASGIYILYLLGEALFKAFTNYYQKIEEEKWTFEKFFTIGSFLGSVYFFLLMIARVVTPVVSDICIYQPTL